MSSKALSRLVNLRKHFQHTDKGDKDGNGGCYLKISPDVSEALSRGNAVVALESTIISHGMPYPQNLQTAKEVESIVRENGAIPATIAILDGVPCIGLNDEELERLANLGTRAQKTARRDIAHVVATRGNGATTVSSTMFFASMVGIPVFVTGGIGGVHRHGESTMDISSDLTELGRTPVAVISAGVKSILDIPRTLEYLETQGVTVAAYKTHEFPSFFTETSGCKVPCRVNSPEDCARLIDANLKLGLGSGILIAVPIPKEHAASGSLIEIAIQKALKEARDNNVTGNAETPFLLARVNELTGGASLAANIALVKHNAFVGAKIAVALAYLRK
ncbi:PREDICTED: uncharacterized protein LOC104586286 isoform X1 [Nelumbo nucifera]|uniref:Pseudouridine-5'-phosphate glycosidase n=2 Tax=Nelumbo nucifera TaxID=4432 RepID=A0A1U7Z3A7_NELNU|nr:PREDICTED: uncharacterized protein LOC104586286 isoform X1 [Nelumbo nucifera]XP_010241762.1 PREDICTED: uncharacterized protein LOC104586286 isoform X1 [Nelumbo nucifera]